MYLLQALNSKNSFIPQSHTLLSVPANVVLGFGKSETTHCPAMPRCPRAVLKASSKWSPENGWNNSIEENMVIICTVILWGLASLAPIETTYVRPTLCGPIFRHTSNHRGHGGDLGLGGEWGTYNSLYKCLQTKLKSASNRAGGITHSIETCSKHCKHQAAKNVVQGATSMTKRLTNKVIASSDRQLVPLILGRIPLMHPPFEKSRGSTRPHYFFSARLRGGRGG